MSLEFAREAKSSAADFQTLHPEIPGCGRDFLSFQFRKKNETDRFLIEGNSFSFRDAPNFAG
jgi:hypothetical protein